MATFTVYSDPPDFLTNAASAVETASLIGGNGTLALACTAAATSLTTQSGLGYGTGSFVLWILDGPNSESIGGCTYSGSTITVPSPGTKYAHGAGVSVSSAGTSGCLAALIRDASAAVETICRQGPDGASSRSLWQQTWTEKMSGPFSSRAAIDRDGTLLLRVYRFPVASVTSCSIQYGATNAVTIDLTYVMLPDSGQVVAIPGAQIIGAVISGAPGFYGTYLPRNVGFVVTLTYVGGPIVGTTLDTVPSDIRRATHYLVLDRLSLRRNPYGAANLRQGDFSIEARLRGDTSGKSTLRMDAEEELRPYVRKL